MRWSLVGLVAILLGTGIAAAGEPEHGFVDLYAGLTWLRESDVSDWKFAEVTATVGGRVGLWIGENWALMFRTWYFQTDAKQEMTSPSDLAVLGTALEILASWRLDDRWAVYGSLGPAMAVTRLDLQDDRRRDQNARSVAPGVSGAVGVEVRILTRLRALRRSRKTPGVCSSEVTHRR